MDKGKGFISGWIGLVVILLLACSAEVFALSGCMDPGGNCYAYRWYIRGGYDKHQHELFLTESCHWLSHRLGKGQVSDRHIFIETYRWARKNSQKVIWSWVRVGYTPSLHRYTQESFERAVADFERNGIPYNVAPAVYWPEGPGEGCTDTATPPPLPLPPERVPPDDNIGPCEEECCE